MFTEHQLSRGAEHPTRLPDRRLGVGNGAQGKGQQYRIEAGVIRRNILRRPRFELNVEGHRSNPGCGQAPGLLAGINAHNMVDLSGIIVGQVVPCPQANFKNAPPGLGYHLLSLTDNRLGATGTGHQARHHVAIVPAHQGSTSARKSSRAR